MTKKKLAEASGVSLRSLSGYESGHLENPSDETLRRLAESLKFPLSFLLADDDLPEPDLETASFRSLARMKASQRDSALALGALGFSFGDWIEKHFQIPEPDLPDLRDLDPEGAAESLRRAWGLGERPAPNMIHLLESKGILVLSLGECSREVDAFCAWNGDRPFVFMNTEKSGERSRMDLAHELGHLVLHRHQNKQDKEIEEEAKVFASAFLLPQADVLAHSRRNPSPGTIIRDKRRWSVSAFAYLVRLHRVGLLSKWRYHQLCKQMTRYRSAEPDPMPREQSKLLPRILDYLRSAGTTRAKLAAELELGRHDLDSLLTGLVITAVDGSGESGGSQADRPTALRLVKR